jgi:hypothetical protein
VRLVEIGRWAIGTCGRRRKSNFVFGGSVVAVLTTVRGPTELRFGCQQHLLRGVQVLSLKRESVTHESFTQASVHLLILGVFLFLEAVALVRRRRCSLSQRVDWTSADDLSSFERTV